METMKMFAKWIQQLCDELFCSNVFQTSFTSTVVSKGGNLYICEEVSSLNLMTPIILLIYS